MIESAEGKMTASKRTASTRETLISASKQLLEAASFLVPDEEIQDEDAAMSRVAKTIDDLHVAWRHMGWPADYR